MNDMSIRGALFNAIKSVIPPLEYSRHKGEAGRIGVIGGCKEYTGAPYFAAISALKVGADLSHVFCAKDAAAIIKSYSPELIVHPILDADNVKAEMGKWLPRLHSIVIGPGLGNDPVLHNNVKVIADMAKELNIPLVFDAEGIRCVSSEFLRSYPSTILTPNAVEFNSLFKSAMSSDAETPDIRDTDVCELAKRMGGVTIVRKGCQDIISNGHRDLACEEEGSPRRCGGQGDLLAGSMAVFHYWCRNAASKGNADQCLSTYGPQMCAAYAACALTRECNRLAFETQRRATLTGDMIAQIQRAFENLFA